MTSPNMPFGYRILHKLTGRMTWLIVLLSLPILATFILGQAAEIQEQAAPRDELKGNSSLYLPIVIKSEPPTPTATPTASPIATIGTVACDIAETYQLIPIKGKPEVRPDDEHADLNLALRSYEVTNEWLGLIDDDQETDSKGPQLYGLFADQRTPAFTSVYQVHNWDWPCNCQDDLISDPVVTLVGMGTTVGEVIQLPDRNEDEIYEGGFKAVVIYAASDRITLKYTRDDDVVQGYTIHVENICVEPDLVALYRQGDDDEERRQLPALAPGQPFGIASATEIGVAIRYFGNFMDPRLRNDWWQNRPLDTPTPTATAKSSLTATPTSASGTATPTATPTLSPIATSTATPTLTPTAMPTTVTSCEIDGQSYELIPIKGNPEDRDDDEHADLNLELRGYEPTSAELGLVDYTGDTDPQAPQLYGLFADQRTPAFSNVYQVYNWDWGCNCRGDLIDDWDVTLAGMVTTAGETIRLPNRQNGDIYQGRFKAVVIYAADNRITLKYTRDDDVVQGYTIHVENVCVEPDLVALYRQGDDNHGRTQLPALAPGQPFGRAMGSEIRVAIRDNGAFMDPRSRKDWWQGR